MMFDSWIHDEGVATMERSEERVCTFCDRDAVALLKFGAMHVHLCEAHVEPRETV